MNTSLCLSQHTISDFILEQLLSSKLEDVVELLLRHGARLGAKTRSHDQMGQHHLLLRHLLAGQIKEELTNKFWVD